MRMFDSRVYAPVDVCEMEIQKNRFRPERNRSKPFFSIWPQSECPRTQAWLSVYFALANSATRATALSGKLWPPILQLNEKFTLWCPSDQKEDLACACTWKLLWRSVGCRRVCKTAWVRQMHTHFTLTTRHWSRIVEEFVRCRQKIFKACSESRDQIRRQSLFQCD